MLEKKIENKFCLIGNGQLLLDNIEYLLSQEQQVCAVISADKEVISWISIYNKTAEAPILLFLTPKDFKSSFDVPFGYLLSIVNYSILTNDIISMASIATINYHAGPLPQYRGVYGTSWAILDGATNYGITWHKVDVGIDTGPILLQYEVDIEPSDDAFSLEIKCASVAKDSFPALFSALQQPLILLEQDVTQAHQYSFNDKLPNNGLIDWNQGADAIIKLYRASVTSNTHPNYLGIIKFLLQGDLYTAERIINTDRKSSRSPGSIITVRENSLEVATQTTNIFIEGVCSLKGSYANLEQILGESQETQPRLEFNKSLASSLEKHPAYQYKNERFWAQQITSISPIVYPGSTVTPSTSTRAPNPNSTQFPLPIKFPISEESPEIIALTTLFILFNNLAPHRTSTIGFIDSVNSSSGENLFLSDKVPFTLELNKKDTLAALKQKVVKQLAILRNYGRYPYDIVIRHPELKNVQTELPITFQIVDSNDALEITDSILHFTFNRETGEMYFYYYPSLHADSHFLHELPNYLKYIIEQISATSDSAILSAIEIMTSQQKQKLISKLPSALKTAPNIEPKETVISLFEKRAKDTTKKENIALRYRENGEIKTISYEELDKKINLLANELQLKGIAIGTPVIVACQKIEEFVISIMATLKVGGTFVPVNPCDTPEDFFQQMFDDLKNLYIITDESSQAFLPANLIKDKVIINASLHRPNQGDVIPEVFSSSISGEDKAYVIYTSGSTGKPNGVAVTQSNILYSTQCRIQYYSEEHAGQEGGKTFNILPILSLSFDAAIGAIFWALCSGNTLNLFDAESKSPEIIVNLIDECGITHLMANPSTYSALLSQTEKARKNFNELHAVILGGEKWDSTIVQQHKKSAPSANLYDEYGPTENTVWTTVKKVAKKNSFTKHPQPQVTIGHPLTPDIKIYILNKEQQPVPPGVTGELYVTGPQIANGYINRGAVTETRFIKLNLAEIFKDDSLPTSVRAYRTGDLARYTSQFDLEYIGRIDDEAKINGHRIDLTGIMGAFKRIPKIRDACVLILQNESNTSCELIAYVVTDLPYTTKTISQLQESLSHQLPNYMIPRKITFLSEIPTTRTGKVDKRKLLALPYNRPSATSTGNLKPNNPVESDLVSIWAELLNIKPSELSVDVNLHDYGLKSIAIPRARTQIYTKFGITFALPEFFEFPTIQEQAQIITARKEPAKSVKTILLTGSTGFLGLHLLLDLINDTNFKIVCLIRGNKQQQPMQKLLVAMQHFGYDNELLNHGRVTVIEGDISKPNLGIEPNEYARLANEIDIVYHCAAHVNHILPHQTLSTINVTGTQNIIKFCGDERAKPLHYVSTLSVSQPNETFITDDNKISGLSGYAESKRAAEKLISKSKAEGLEVTIYRPSWIAGHSQSGKFLEAGKDHLLCLTRACAMMGFAPNWSMQIDALPVDMVSKIISSISLHPGIEQHVYNIFDPKGISWNEYITLVGQSSGKPIQIIDKKEWLKKLELEFVYEGFPLSPFKDLYNANATWLTEQEIQPPFTCSNTIAMFGLLGIHIQPISAELITKYMQNNSSNSGDTEEKAASPPLPPFALDDQELLKAVRTLMGSNHSRDGGPLVLDLLALAKLLQGNGSPPAATKIDSPKDVPNNHLASGSQAPSAHHKPETDFLPQ